MVWSISDSYTLEKILKFHAFLLTFVMHGKKIYMAESDVHYTKINFDELIKVDIDRGYVFVPLGEEGQLDMTIIGNALARDFAIDGGIEVVVSASNKLKSSPI